MYTQVPNELIDRIPELSGAAVKTLFVISRHTHGWHRDNVALSLADLQKKTGLSRSSVVRAMTELIDAGLLEVTRKTVNGQMQNVYAISTTRPVLTAVEQPPAKAMPPELTVRVLDRTSGFTGACSVCGLPSPLEEYKRYGMCSFCYVKNLRKPLPDFL